MFDILSKLSKNMTANCTDTVNRTVMGHINLHKRSVCAVDFVNYIDRILGQETSKSIVEVITKAEVEEPKKK